MTSRCPQRLIEARIRQNGEFEGDQKTGYKRGIQLGTCPGTWWSNLMESYVYVWTPEH